MRRPRFLPVMALSAVIAGQPVLASADQEVHTATPIKHLIVIIGENHSFDNVFGTYRPRHGQTVWNLLSEGIVNANGT
ncbi:MAG: phosphoesterase, partial [Gammaproteobacteria bacterium]|nr:phosphoesterase [Gammaproteobacteria bacterium]